MTGLKVEQVEQAFSRFIRTKLDIETATDVACAMLELLKLADDHESVMQNDYWFCLCANYIINIWQLDDDGNDQYRIGIYGVDEDGDIDYDDPIWSSVGCI